MIGVPGSGKSTWLSSQHWNNNTVIVSTDTIVEEYAKSVNQTYSDVFKEYMPTAVKIMMEQVISASDSGKDIVWDQTSVNVKSRAKKFRALPNYNHIAVVVLPPKSIEEHQTRLKSRPGKNISWNLVQSMLNSFEMPTFAEGYSEIWIVDNGQITKSSIL